MPAKDTPPQGETVSADNTAVKSPDIITIHYSDNDDIPLRLAPWQLRLVRCLANRKLSNEEE
ncbi:hypothetical protein [Phytobacter sp. RSE-02]|jgi:hypothetical protein|uniref:hypothetical protein n=1 Tax=Phytobacter sp. RSE-02 TaxID=3229229 RepID=UPI00339DA1CA